jgi:beta-galactosidase
MNSRPTTFILPVTPFDAANTPKLSLMKKRCTVYFFLMALMGCIQVQAIAQVVSFNDNWKFHLGDADASAPGYNDDAWRKLSLPHDWSIELPFDAASPTGTGGGALRGGIGWYRKTFMLPAAASGKNIFIDFDGVYCNSEVFINGHSLGIRPNGFISFRYDLTPYLKFGNQPNIVAVKADNSHQPNARWYSGSGIYRNVWLVTANGIHVDHWGSYVTTPAVTEQSASVHIQTSLRNSGAANTEVQVITTVYDEMLNAVQTRNSGVLLNGRVIKEIAHDFIISRPRLWSIDHPYLYKAVTQLLVKGKLSVPTQRVLVYGILILMQPKDFH